MRTRLLVILASLACAAGCKCGPDKLIHPPEDPSYPLGGIDVDPRACETDQDCVHTCTRPGHCCADGCNCESVYSARFLEEVRKVEQYYCKPDGFTCPKYRCPRTGFEIVGRCVDGQCQAEKMPLSDAESTDACAGPEDDLIDPILEEDLRAPYMAYVPLSQTVTASMALESTSVQVEAVGPLARVTYRQVHVNEGQSGVRAIYVVPGQEQTRVQDAKLSTGRRVVKSLLAPIDQVLEGWQAAKAQGKAAPLLVVDHPQELQLYAGPVGPGARITTEVTWTARLHGVQSALEIRVPHPTAPRTTQVLQTRLEGERAYETWKLPGQPDPEASVGTLEAQVHIESPIALGCHESPTHQMSVERTSAQEVSLGLEATEAGAARHLRVRFGTSTAGERKGMWVLRKGDDGWLAATVFPAPSADSPPHREWIIVIRDNTPTHYARPILRAALPLVRLSDRVNMITYGKQASLVWEESRVADEKARQELVQGYGQDESSLGEGYLIPALDVLEKQPPPEGTTRFVLLISAGFENDRLEGVERLDELSRTAVVIPVGPGSFSYRNFLRRAALPSGMPPVIIGDHNLAKNRFGLVALRLGPIQRRGLTPVLDDGADVTLMPSALGHLFASTPVTVVGRHRGPLSEMLMYTAPVMDKIFGFVPDPSQPPDTADWVRMLYERTVLDTRVFALSAPPEQIFDAHIQKMALEHGAVADHTAFAVATADAENSDVDRWYSMHPLPFEEMFVGVGLSGLGLTGIGKGGGGPAGPGL